MSEVKIMWTTGAKTLVSHPRRSAALGEIEAYWQALRQDGHVPARADVDPRGLQRALSHAFILERMAPGMARVRVSGQSVNQVLGMDMRGMPISSLFTAGARDGFRDILEQVFCGPSMATLRLTSRQGYLRAPLEAEMMMLPLRGSREDVTRILGGLVVNGDIGRDARRFDIKNSFARRLGVPNDPPHEIAQDTQHSHIISLDDTRFKPTKAAHLRVLMSET